MDEELKSIDTEEEKEEQENGGKAKLSTLGKIKHYFFLFLKTVLLLAIFAINVEAVVDGWLYSQYYTWKIGMTLAVILLVIILAVTWRKTTFPERWAITFIYPIVILTMGTVFYGIENEGGPFIFSKGNPQLINILFMFVACAITIMFFISKSLNIAIKIFVGITAIITVTGFTLPILWEQNLHQALQGQANAYLEAFPFFLRPTFLGIFLFYPLSLLLFIKQIALSLKYEEKINRITTIYPMIPVILLLAVGVRTLIISAPVEKVYSINDFSGMKGRGNIALQKEGGRIISFTSQLDIYKDAAYNLIDGDIIESGWQSEKNAPFPQEIIIGLPGNKTHIIDQVIIYNDALVNDSKAAKEIEILVSADSPNDFELIKKYVCQNTLAPQVFTFKETKAKFIQVRILSNWGNTISTSIKEIEVSGPATQEINLDPLKGNLLEQSLGAQPVTYRKKSGFLEEIPYQKPFQGKDAVVALQMTQDDFPVEIVFNLPESKTYIVDNLVMHFFSADEKLRSDITEVKEMEILTSSDSPTVGFESLGKFLCTKGKAAISFSLQQKNVKYIKLKFLEPMEKNKFVVIKNIELYQPMAKYENTLENGEYRSGLKGLYFTGKKYKDFRKERKDPEINFNWGVQSPMSGFGSADYSIIWEGILEVPTNGYYEIGLKTNEDDYFKFELNNNTILKSSSSKTDQWVTKKFRLAAGAYPIKIVYFHPRGNDSVIKLGWKKPGKNTIEIIENKYLTHKSSEINTERTPKEAIKAGIEWMGENVMDSPKKYSSTRQPFALMTFAKAAKYKYPYNTEACMSVLDLIRSGINRDGTLSFSSSTTIMALQCIGIGLMEYNNYIEEENTDELIRIGNRLVGKQLPQGNWEIDQRDLPVLQGDIMCTANALLILLNTYEKTGDEFFSKSIQNASIWLEKATPETTQDIVYQLIGLCTYPSPSSEKVIKKDIEKLWSIQNEDGGWGEGENKDSNPYSTAQVIYALKLAKVEASNPNFNTGLDYILSNQNITGGWSLKAETDETWEVAPTMWCITALANAYESLMIRITKPSPDETFTPESSEQDFFIETDVYNPGDTKVTRVEFFVDNLSIGTAEKSPYTMKWQPQELSGGKHTVKVVLHGDDGSEVVDSKTFYVDKSIKISFISPEENTKVPLDTKIKIDIENKSNSPVTKVEFYIEDELIDKVKEKPFELLWLTEELPNGKYTLKAIVHTEKGDTSSAEETVIVDRNFGITLDSPQEDENVEENMDLSATVVNDTGSPTTRVEYYVDEKLVGTSTEGPSYSCTWEVKDIKNGNYPVKAVAYNELGNKISDTKTISISYSLKIKLKNISDSEPVTGEQEIWSQIENQSGTPIKEVIYYLDGRPIGKSSEGGMKVTGDVIAKLKEKKYSDSKLKAIKTLQDKSFSSEKNMAEQLNGLTFKEKDKDETEKEMKLTEKEVEQILSLSENKTPYKIVWDTTEYASGFYNLKAIVYSGEEDKAHSEMEIKIEHPIKFSVYSTVANEKGKYTITLKKEDFIVKEDGSNQKIISVEKCKDNTPTAYCILMDTGKHMDEYMKETKKVIQNFIDKLPSLDDSSIIVFSDEIIKSEKLTKENKDFKDMVEDIEPEGGTAIYDALYEGINLLKTSDKRKVLILFTAAIDENGEGTGPASKQKLDKIIKEATDNNCLIYIVAIGPWADTFILSDLTGGTGGRCYSTSKEEEIEKKAGLVKLDLNSQYKITCQSGNPARDGKWRTLKIEIVDKENYSTNNQNGYFAPEY